VASIVACCLKCSLFCFGGGGFLGAWYDWGPAQVYLNKNLGYARLGFLIGSPEVSTTKIWGPYVMAANQKLDFNQACEQFYINRHDITLSVTKMCFGTLQE
jgi:hypothetical protein